MLVFISLDCSESPSEKKDTTPPAVYLTAPAAGEVVSELVTITAYAQDNEGIDWVEFLINDTCVSPPGYIKPTQYLLWIKMLLQI